MPQDITEADEEVGGILTKSEADRGERPDKGERKATSDRRKSGRGQSGRGQSGSGGGLERVTVNLIPRASRALEKAGELTGDSKTDAINRALQVYAYLEEVWSKGGSVEVEVEGKRTELKFF